MGVNIHLKEVFISILGPKIENLVEWLVPQIYVPLIWAINSSSQSW